MSLIPSTMIPLGTTAPDFTLPDTVSGRQTSLNDIRGTHGTLIMFICNHCPYVIHIQRGLAQLGRDYAGGEIGITAISANDAASYPEDAPDKMKTTAERQGFTFPYLHDADQETAIAYGAVCTPDFFLFDGNLKCAYRGQFDDSRPGKATLVTGTDLRRAMNHLIAGTPIPSDDQKPSTGCSIKWK